MGTSDPEGVAQWLADYDAAFEADVSHAERGWSGPPREPQPSLPLTGGTLVLLPSRGDAPEPWPGSRDRNWYRDLGRRTAVGGRERIALDALLDRIWTGEDCPRENRRNGQWTGWLDELRGDCGMSMSYATMKRAIAGLISRGVIERRLRGRVRVSRGRGKSTYTVNPANPCERRES